MTCSPQLDTSFLRDLFRFGLVLAALAACGDDDAGRARDGSAPLDDAAVPHQDAAVPRDDAAIPQQDAGAPHADGGSSSSDAGGMSADAGTSSDAGPPPYGGLEPDTNFADHDLDLFTPGNRFWFEVSDRQLARMNLERGGSGGPIIDAQRLAVPVIGGVDGDIYTPSDTATWADQLIIEDVTSGHVADYGKVEAALVGESTGRSWDFLHIPNVRVDANEFEHGKKIGGFEHLRLNNGLVGSIFREGIAHRVYRELGYPALRSSWAFMGSNVWGHDVWVPMVLMEVYKKKFCNDNAEMLGGTCDNMWEFPGNIGEQVGSIVPDSACQVGECDHSRLEELNDVVAATPIGPGIKPALEDLLDWQRFHEFQCLSWIMWTGDDPIHSGNNNLIIERDDGKMIWAPYSIDISAGNDWYTNVPLVGTMPIATRCQADPDCWADTIATCEDLIAKFDDLDPEKLVDDALESLGELGMLRDGDEGRAEQLRDWYVQRQQELPEELERFRYLPDEFDNCPDGYELCGDGACGTAEQCVDRMCTLGEMWCESKQSCINTSYDTCPTCRDPRPLHCDLNNRCVADEEACHASCAKVPGQIYCAAYQSCASEGECPADEDGGVIFEL